MIQPGTRLKVADNSGAQIIECFGILGYSKIRSAEVGDYIIASVKKARKGGTVEKKEIVRALIVRQRKPRRRKNGTVIKFDDNAAVIVSENLKELVGNRINGPIPHEIRELIPTIASLASEIV
jgi:large subunit ribosomal protein L14